MLGLMISLLIGLIVFPTRQSHAQDDQRPRVTIVVLDQSGSMRTEGKPRDPLGLRCSAVRLLTDLATARDYLALVKLESRDLEDDLTAEVLSPPVRMGQEDNRIAYKKKIDCDRATNNTPIADALQKAYQQLEGVSATLGSFDGQVLLLTDGDPAPKSKDQIKQIDVLLPKYQIKGWRISTIGLKLEENKQKAAKGLLKRMADQTGGTFYGDVAEPIELQPIFIKFFAQQTGRNLDSGRLFSLVAGGEYPVPVPDAASRIDILVAKENADAVITLVDQNNNEVQPSLNGEDTRISNSDPFYAAFLINRPVKGNWKIRADKTTNVIVSTLINYSLDLQFEESDVVRPANKPIVLKARFYDTQGASPTPSVASGANVEASLELGGQSQNVGMRDDGQTPDLAANDGIFTGNAILPDTALPELELVSGNVTISGQYQGRSYNKTGTIKVVPVPVVVPELRSGVLRLAPGSPVDVPLRLEYRGKSVPSTGWNVKVQQIEDGGKQSVIVDKDGDRFVAHLYNQPEGKEEYVFEVTLVGIDQNAGVPDQVFPPLQTQVRFQPILDLAYQGPSTIPAGYPITLTGALLSRFNEALPRQQPLDMKVSRDNGIPVDVIGKPSTQNGVFDYTVELKEPGVYRFTLSDREQRVSEDDKKEMEITVEPRPEVVWTQPPQTNEGLQQTLVRWPWLDTLRNFPLTGWGVDLFASDKRSELLNLQGTVTSGGQSFSESPQIRIIEEANEQRVLYDREQETDGVSARVDLPGGRYRVELVFRDLFDDPSIDCCVTSMPLLVEQSVDSSDLGWAGSILIVEIIIVFVLFLLAHFCLTTRPQYGDKIVVQTAGQEKSLDLGRNWRINIFRPRRSQLRKKLKGLGLRINEEDKGIVEYKHRNVTIDRKPLSSLKRNTADKATFVPAEKRRRSGRPKAGRSPHGPNSGLFASFTSLLRGPRPTPRNRSRVFVKKRK